MDRREALDEWLGFTIAESHVLRVRPRLLFQQAANQSESTAPARAASRRLEAGRATGAWLRRVNKRGGGPSGPRLVLAGGRPCGFSPDGRRILGTRDPWLQAWDANSGAEVATLVGHAGSVTSFVFSPDGTRVVSSSTDGTLRVWETESGAEMARLEGHEGPVLTCAYSPDGRRIVSGGDDATARLWDGRTGEPIATLEGHEIVVLDCAFSPDGRRVVTYGRDETLRVWDAEAGALLAWSGRHQHAVGPVALSPDGTSILTRSGEDMALWDWGSGAPPIEGEPAPRIWQSERFGHSSHDYRAFVLDCCFSPDGRRIVSASQDGTLGVWDGRTGRRLRRLAGHEGSVTSCDVSPDGARIVSSSVDGTLRLWEVEREAPATVLAELGREIGFAAFSPDGSTVLTATGEELRVWDARGVRVERPGHRGNPLTCAFSPDGRWILSVAIERGPVGLETPGSELRMWDGETGEVPSTTPPDWLERCEVTCAAFFPEGERVVTGFHRVREGTNPEEAEPDPWSASREEHGLCVWDPRGRRARFDMPGRPEVVLVTPDGTRILAAMSSGSIHVLDAASGDDLIQPWKGGDRIVLSPTGERLASAFYLKGGPAKVWDTATGAELAAFEGPSYFAVREIRFSPDGRRLAVVSSGDRVTVWEVDTRREVGTMPGSSCAFTPDAGLLLTTDRDAIRVWEGASCAPRGALRGGVGAVRNLHPAPDGRWLAALTSDGTVQIWDLDRRCAVWEWLAAGTTLADWTPDGRALVAAGGGDGVPSLLRLEVGRRGSERTLVPEVGGE